MTQPANFKSPDKNKIPYRHQLVYLLASLYNTPDEIKGVLQNAELDNYLVYISFHFRATVYWSNIISYFQRHGLLNTLIEAVLHDGNHDNEFLMAILANHETDYRGPYYKSRLDKSVNVKKNQLERLTRGTSTLLPISFLEMGLVKAKPVVRIVTNKSLGSGFIIQNDYLLTNNHIIDTAETARSATIQFNYQESISHEKLSVVAKRLDPGSAHGFATSVENDWSLVKVRDFSDSDRQQYMPLTINEVKIDIDDFVNIIQHPGGEAKKIALYHNMVVGYDTDRIQYLTDTQQGSSGSPVFNTNWDVVALHHSSEMIKIKGTNTEEPVNEGININLVLEEIRNMGIPL